MVNKVILIGRLAADPDVRATPSGTHVASLRLATRRMRPDDAGGRQEEVEFHDLVVFGRQAEIAASYLRKGRLLYADGRLHTRTWQGTDGQHHRRTEIVVERFQMLGPRRQHEDADPAGTGS
ncbi:MAG TPA: single-stranded DNA-binding protein [Candidatus Dormibacteraeota bacterium]|jgi:single-strand DNA-binding protein|nr:single-stranded DNA-binding protein [Candidatus Dormibacteraeota bacterium]